MTAIAPATSSHRRYRLPCLVILPSLSLPPLDDRTDAWDLFQPPARLARPVPGHDTAVDRSDLGSNGAVLTRQHIEYPAGRWGNPAILGIGNDLEQSAGSFAALCRHDAEFGQMPPYGVAQHRALTHQQLSGPVQHQGGLLLLRLDRNKPHRWSRHCLADRRRIVRVVLATLEIGLHIARRHQLHRVAKCLQLATPVMGRGTGLDADQARLQAGKELQQLRPTDTLANNHRPSLVDAVSLEYRLRNIETDCDNLAHGRLPS